VNGKGTGIEMKCGSNEKTDAAVKRLGRFGKMASIGQHSCRKPAAKLQQSSSSVAATGKPSGNEAGTRRERGGNEAAVKHDQILSQIRIS
jgi:hypothetical protein